MPDEGYKQKWEREHAERERKEVSEDQLVTSLLTFVITHRKYEGKVQEVGYLPWAAESPGRIGGCSCLLHPGPWLVLEPGSYSGEGSRSASRALC